jgi:hypothetical protein
MVSTSMQWLGVRIPASLLSKPPTDLSTKQYINHPHSGAVTVWNGYADVGHNTGNQSRLRAGDEKHDGLTANDSSASASTTPVNSKTPRAHKRRNATEDDARRAGIPPGYSYHHWDPSEGPTKLLGSVFDLDSLGKWIYDWAVSQSGSVSPIAEMAGQMWLHIIQLSGKMKRADEKCTIIVS